MQQCRGVRAGRPATYAPSRHSTVAAALTSRARTRKTTRRGDDEEREEAPSGADGAPSPGEKVRGRRDMGMQG